MTPNFKYRNGTTRGMLDLHYRVHEAGDVTLVAAVVESSAPTPRRVRVESTLDGPIWPPRRDGVPGRGWDEEGFEGVVPANGRLALGFASPAPPTEPPLFVVEHERASTGGTDAGPTDRAGQPVPPIPEATPDGVLRALGSPRPPRDAIPRPSAEEPESSGGTPSQPGRPAEPWAGRPPGETIPEEVADWLWTVEERVRRAEALADAERLTTAARELEAVGGLDEAERLVESLQRDERALRALARRAERLADRSADAEVPLSSFRRLA